VADLGGFLEELSRNLVVRTWGSFGWYSVRFPAWFALALTVVVVGLVASALWPRSAASGSSRVQRAWFLSPVAALGAVVVTRAWGIYATSSQFQFMQGRYLFAGVTGVLVLVGIGGHRLVGRAAPLAVAGFAAVLQVVALRQALVGWWGGPGLGPRGQLRAMVAWSGWPGEVVGVVLLAAVAAASCLAFTLVADLRRTPAEEDGQVVSGTA
jgi:hypothetical protein